VTLIDDNPRFGGQIWRASLAKVDPRAAAYIAILEGSNAQFMSGAAIHSAEGEDTLLGEDASGPFSLAFEKLILAPGARELFLPFPGWTLPGVFGAGGLQALVKGGLDIHGKRILVAGTGPLLLAVATYLKHHGAVIGAVLEQTDRSTLNRFAASLWRSPGKLVDAAAMRLRLGLLTYKPDSWITKCERSAKGLNVTYVSRGRPSEAECDYVACGFHLIPSVELALMLGCEVDNGRVRVDSYQLTSKPWIYCVGEATGIGGVDLAIADGEVAGLWASDQYGRFGDSTRKRDRLRQFAADMNATFAIRDDVKKLAEDSTIVCRCEDVTFGRLRSFDSWRTAKLMTRCGMGPCQGRICGAATRTLFGWGPDDVRQPIFPVKLENL
jgi:NADPH-dependent 2,4-dienoyl-CoA reductase/sulfur reductase-like enzyme